MKRKKRFRGGGAHTLKKKSLNFIAYVAIEMDMMHLHVSFLGTELIRKETKPKVKPVTKRKVKYLNLLTKYYRDRYKFSCS